VTRWIVVVVVVMVALLAFPFARHEWHVWRLHPTCTTANLAVDFGPNEDGASERWGRYAAAGDGGLPTGQWDRSKIDITKI
jgi:hypothetical protein